MKQESGEATNPELLRHLVDRVKEIVREAGEAILKVAGESDDASIKADGSPLTRADLASHGVIQAALEALETGFPILSEEGDPEALGREGRQTYWCVDPLDGTKEFMKGLGEYTVNVALVEGALPILGAVYVPVQDVLYYAARSLGAWKVQAGHRPKRISAGRCERPKIAVVSRSHLSPETQEFLRRLNVTKVIRRGSSIKICAVAEGAADIYPRHGPTCLWDTAAGAAVARESGCSVVDLAGRPLSYDPAGGIRHSGFVVCRPGPELRLAEPGRGHRKSDLPAHPS